MKSTAFFCAGFIGGCVFGLTWKAEKLADQHSPEPPAQVLEYTPPPPEDAIFVYNPATPPDGVMWLRDIQWSIPNTTGAFERTGKYLRENELGLKHDGTVVWRRVPKKEEEK